MAKPNLALVGGVDADEFAAEKGAFHTSLTETARILKLGQALSAGRFAAVATRLPNSDNFLLGRIEPDETPEISGIAAVSPAGSTDNVAAPLAPLFAAMFDAQPEAQAVAIFRGHRLAVWAAAGRPLPVAYFQMLGYTKAKEIPVSPVDAEQLRATVIRNQDAPAVLLEDGSAVVWTKDADKLARFIISLEEAAYVTGLAERIGGAKPYPDAVRSLIQDSLQAQTRLA